VAAPTPLYVLEKDVDRERVVVGPAAALATARIGVRGARLHRGGREVDRVKLRYRAEPVACRIEERAVRGDHEQLTLALEQAITGAAPGQLACLMSGPLVIGSATIAECHPTVGAVAGAATGERA
jgi:tRNA U34 2-thiouridine synthase MnmA/TrmU